MANDVTRTPVQWLELQINTLFRSDAKGRLLWVNEVGNPPAPRFFFGRTATGNHWRFRHDLPPEIVDELTRFCAAEPITAEFTSPPRHAAAIREVLHRHAPIVDEDRGPAYASS